MDNLKFLLEKQAELDNRILESLEISDRDRLRDLLTALMVETGELANVFAGFKYWKKSHDFKSEEFKEELIDVLHFLLSICNMLNMGSFEIVQEYMKKNKKNIKRQDNGY